MSEIKYVPARDGEIRSQHRLTDIASHFPFPPPVPALENQPGCHYTGLPLYGAAVAPANPHKPIPRERISRIRAMKFLPTGRACFPGRIEFSPSYGRACDPFHGKFIGESKFERNTHGNELQTTYPRFRLIFNAFQRFPSILWEGRGGVIKILLRIIVERGKGTCEKRLWKIKFLFVARKYKA